MGTMYFVLHPHDQQMAGRWVGLSYDGKVVPGLGGDCASEVEARHVITSSVPSWLTPMDEVRELKVTAPDEAWWPSAPDRLPAAG